jgi:hypothetical protein
MHPLKVNDGYPQLQKMEKGNKLHLIFLCSFIMFIKLEVECHHVQLWHKSFHSEHFGYSN